MATAEAEMSNYLRDFISVSDITVITSEEISVVLEV